MIRARISVAGAAVVALLIALSVVAPSYARASGRVPTRTWNALAACESSNRWHLNYGPGTATGGLQITRETWHEFGGKTAQAYQAAPSVQKRIAQKIKVVQGWNAWPTCSRKLHLR